MFNTLLIFPPFWSNYYPYLSLPVLKAYLKQNGHEVNQWDINATLNSLDRDRYDSITRRGWNLASTRERVLSNVARKPSRVSCCHFDSLLTVVAGDFRVCACLSKICNVAKGELVAMLPLNLLAGRY